VSNVCNESKPAISEKQNLAKHLVED